MNAAKTALDAALLLCQTEVLFTVKTFAAKNFPVASCGFQEICHSEVFQELTCLDDYY